jgi:3-methyladenine DNA glycosylase AlkD
MKGETMAGTTAPTTLDEAMQALEGCGSQKVREIYRKRGAPESLFGVNAGDIRTISKSIKTNHELGLALWGTGNCDAMLLATLVMKPKLLSEDDVERMAASVPFAKVATPIAYTQVADWLMTNIIRQHPSKESLRLRWMKSSHQMLARAGWSLTTERVIKGPEGLDMSGLLDRIEGEMGSAPAPAQWTMNYCLAEIGIRFPEHRQRAIGIGEKFGLYRDYPVSKGCTSPFAPIWIGAMVSRAS